MLPYDIDHVQIFQKLNISSFIIYCNITKINLSAFNKDVGQAAHLSLITRRQTTFVPFESSVNIYSECFSNSYLKTQTIRLTIIIRQIINNYEDCYLSS